MRNLFYFSFTERLALHFEMKFVLLLSQKITF